MVIENDNFKYTNLVKRLEDRMRSDRFIRVLEESKNSVFSLGDLVRALNKDEKYVKVFLNRLVKKDLLVRIERNKYSLPNQNPFSVASLLVFPSYVSFISAYSYYDLTTQIPSTIFIVSLRQKKEVLYGSYRIRFVKFSRKRFFGYLREYVEGKTVFMAEVEKAILDSLFLPKYCPVLETFSALREAKLDYERLLEYVKKFNSRIVAKRLGFLLDSTGTDLYDSLKHLIDKNYEVLNPLKPPAGRKDRRWGLIVNEVLE
jgi:predicted transcriptional regulator of viral defense system